MRRLRAKKQNTVRIHKKSNYHKRGLFITGLLFGILGLSLQLRSMAATTFGVIEAESAIKSGNVTTIADSTASGGSAVEFSLGGTVATGNAHLNKILSATSRFKLNDNPAYVNKPSAGLENDPNLISSNYISSYTRNPSSELQVNPSLTYGEYRAECDFSHFSYDDPIKYPGQPGVGHLHMFFGNTHATVYSDYNSIMNSGNSTCNGHEINRTVYWTAALLDQDGNPRIPMKILVYYKSYNLDINITDWWSPGSNGLQYVKPIPFPENLQMLSNYTGCTSTTLSLDQVKRLNQCPPNQVSTYYAKNRELNQFATWTCGVVWSNGAHNGNDYNTFNDQTQIPTCPGPVSLQDNPVKTLQEHVIFPYCSDGRDLRGLSYSEIVKSFRWNISGDWFWSICPGTHPSKIPMIEYKISYPIYPGEDTSNWRLSSDIDPNTGKMLTTPYGYWTGQNLNQRVTKTATNGATSHGGWMGGWNRSILNQWVQSCNWVRGANCFTGVFPVPYSSSTKALKIPNRLAKNPNFNYPIDLPFGGWFNLELNNVFKADGQLLHSEICGRPKLFTVGGDIPKGADISHCIRP